jgi:hypothetical protein
MFLSCGILFSFTLIPLDSRAADQRVLYGHVPPAVTRLGLQPVGRLPSTNRLHLAIGLPLRNQEAFATLLQQIYDPASPNYRHYLTPQQFTERFGPTEQDYQAVLNFAETNGLKMTGSSGNRVLLDVSGKVSDIERAFRVKLLTYQHPTEARRFFAPDVEPSVDTNVPVLDISGLNNYTLPHTMLYRESNTENAKMVSASGSGLHGSYMGHDFRNAYVPGVALDGTGQMVGLVDYINGYNPEDIATYAQTAGLPIPKLLNVLLDNASGVPSGDTSEACLDIEMVISMATNLDAVVVFEGDMWNDILNCMATSNQIKQFSSSWSFGAPTSGNNYWTYGGPTYTSDQILQVMAVQGQSFFMASGDGGAWTSSFMDFGWPAGDPWVTCVGGTTLSTTSQPQGAYVSESVWTGGYEATAWPLNGEGYWASGGGVSAVYPIPVWQQGVNMSTNEGSTTMRNIPDVALTANNVWVVYDGTNGIFGGTSCAAPLWAGFTALVNQQATSIPGGLSVGFLNPAIYAIGLGPNYTSCFHDIQTGNNNWYGVSSTDYYATSGYDLCTGWGTPNGSNLINALVAILPSVPSPTCFFTTYVSGASGPWNCSLTLNASYQYGTNESGVWNTNQSPSVVTGSSGLAFIPGAKLLIRSLTPGQPGILVGSQGGLWCDANGVVSLPCGPSSPGWYIGTNYCLGELLGTFADATGAIIPKPFAIGNGPIVVTIPPGAIQLLLGVNDGWYNDNGGGVEVCITEVCVPAPTNLVLWLPFDETNGTASANLASPTNYGTQVGNPTPVLGAHVANSLGFNGVNQSVTVPDYPDIEIGTNDFTIDAWIQCPTNSSGVHTIVDKRTYGGGKTYSGYIFDLYDNTLLIQLDPGYYNGNNEDTSTLPADGNWHFVAVTVQRTSTNGIQFYVDGQPTGTSNPTTREGNLSNNASMQVGGSTLAGTYWLGGLDEVEVFNRALTPAEIQAIYNIGSGGKCKSCCTNDECISITCTDIVIYSSGPVPVFYPPPTVTDLCCGTNWSAVYSPTNGTYYKSGTPGSITNVQCVVADACGNSNICSFTVDVIYVPINTVSNLAINLQITNNQIHINVPTNFSIPSNMNFFHC